MFKTIGGWIMDNPRNCRFCFWNRKGYCHAVLKKNVMMEECFEITRLIGCELYE